MIKSIFEIAKSEPALAALLETAREYAAVYLMAKNRQKGCDGMGELATMKEEFKDTVDKVMQYCKDEKYIPEDLVFDIDTIAEEIERS